MSEQDYEQLTLFREDSPASRSVKPGSKEARMMTVTSGLKCLESYTNSDPLGSLVRMCLGSSIWHSTRCLLTWKEKVIPSSRLLYRLAVSTPRTKETECSFWPTPSTGAALCAGTGNFKTLKAMVKRGIITEEERRNLSQGNGGKTNPALIEWLMGYEQQFTKLIPTPRASDCYRAPIKNFWMSEREYRRKLNELVECTPLGKIGPMNPNWTEWLMGYPIGWTDLNASETP